MPNDSTFLGGPIEFYFIYLDVFIMKLAFCFTSGQDENFVCDFVRREKIHRERERLNSKLLDSGVMTMRAKRRTERGGRGRWGQKKKRGRTRVLYAHRVPHTSSSRFTSAEEDLESSPREFPQR